MRSHKEVIATARAFELAVEHWHESIDYETQTRRAEGYYLTMRFDGNAAYKHLATGRYTRQAIKAYAKAHGSSSAAEALWQKIGSSKPLSDMVRA